MAVAVSGSHDMASSYFQAQSYLFLGSLSALLWFDRYRKVGSAGLEQTTYRKKNHCGPCHPSLPLHPVTKERPYETDK